MKTKTNLVIGVIFLALLGFVYIHEIKGGQERESAAAQAKKLADFSDHEAKRLVLERGDTLIALEKSQGSWQMTRPVVAAADQDAVERYLTNLRETERERVVEDSAAVAGDAQLPGRYGLETPRLKILLQTTEATLDSFYLGADSPTERFTYMQRGGANPEIFTVRAWRFDNLDKSVFDLRDRRVLPFAKDEVVELQLQPAAAEPITVVKAEDGWRLKAPVDAAADAAAVDGLLGRLDGAEVEAFAVETPTSDELESFGLAAAQTLSLVLFLGEERAEKRLLVGGRTPEGHYYGRDSGRAPVFVADSSLVHDLTKTPFDLRDKNPVTFDRDRVDRLVLERAADRIEARLDTAANWAIVAPEARQAKSWRFNGMLTEAEQIEVKEFTADGVEDLGQYGLDAPGLRLRLMAGDETLAELGFGRQEGDGVYFCQYGEDAVYRVDAEVLKELDLSLEDLALEPPAVEASDEAAAGGEG